jgi:hypothetical protein
MADFVKDNSAEGNPENEGTADSHEKAVDGALPLIDATKPEKVLYCAICSMPPEFCEYGSCFDKCLPWIVENCPEVLSEEITQSLAKFSLEDGGEAEEVMKHLYFL